MTHVNNRNPHSNQTKRLLGAAVGAGAAAVAKAQCYVTDIEPVGAGIQLNGTSYGVANIRSECLEWRPGTCSTDAKGYTSCSGGHYDHYELTGYRTSDRLKRLVDMLAKALAGVNRTFNASVVGGYPIPSDQPILTEVDGAGLIGPHTGTAAERALITAFQNEVNAQNAADTRMTGIIVGSVIAGISFLALCIVAYRCCCAKGRRRRSGDIEMPEVPRAAVASVVGATAGAVGAVGAARARVGATTGATAGEIGGERQASPGAEVC